MSTEQSQKRTESNIFGLDFRQTEDTLKQLERHARYDRYFQEWNLYVARMQLALRDHQVLEIEAKNVIRHPVLSAMHNCHRFEFLSKTLIIIPY
jgi:hypothetical protein